MKESTNLTCHVNYLFCFFVTEITKVLSYDYLGFDFSQRTSGMMEKLLKFSLGGFAPALGNIAGDRDGSSPDLTGETKNLLFGKLLA